MTKVVCNSSPIIGLSMVGKLDLLWEIFDEVYIPNAVYHEIVFGNQLRRFGEKELSAAVEKGEIKLYTVKQKNLVEQMYGRLHRGELEVIISAKEIGINWVIIDDKLARSFADTMLLKPIGLLGVLLIAKRMNKIDNMKSCLDILINEGYRISPKLYYNVLSRAGED